MDARFYLGTKNGQVMNVPSECYKIENPPAEADQSRYVRIGGTTFTIAANGAREDEEALFVLSSELVNRAELEIAIEAYERGY